MAKIGVVLSGCGVYDGSEITEAVSTLIALARRGLAYRCMAPDMEFEVTDHRTTEPSGERRNALTEAARIARGEIDDLKDVDVNDYDAFIFPGGFGAAKNLSSFASDGPDCTVHPEVERIVNGAHAKGKPLGFICIAPAVGARVLGAEGVELTIGDDAGTAGALESMGASHTNAGRSGIVHDEARNVTSTPAYMYGDSSPAQVFDGIDALVENIASRVGAAV